MYILYLFYSFLFISMFCFIDCLCFPLCYAHYSSTITPSYIILLCFFSMNAYLSIFTVFHSHLTQFICHFIYSSSFSIIPIQLLITTLAFDMFISLSQFQPNSLHVQQFSCASGIFVSSFSLAMSILYLAYLYSLAKFGFFMSYFLYSTLNQLFLATIDLHCLLKPSSAVRHYSPFKYITISEMLCKCLLNSTIYFIYKEFSLQHKMHAYVKLILFIELPHPHSCMLCIFFTHPWFILRAWFMCTCSRITKISLLCIHDVW